MIEYNGLTLSLTKWAKMSGIPYSTIKERYQNGCSAEECLGIVPVKGDRNLKEVENETLEEFIRRTDGVSAKEQYEEHQDKRKVKVIYPVRVCGGGLYWKSEVISEKTAQRFMAQRKGCEIVR